MSIKQSTFKSYEKELAIFQSYCTKNNFDALPATTTTVKIFMFHHVNSRAMSTLPIALSAISHFHSKYHYPTPTSSRAVTRALEGAKQSFGKLSVSAKIFRKEHLVTVLSSQIYSFTCYFVFLRTVWRIFIEFFGLLRFNKVSNLRFNDLSWTPIGFDLFIHKSKTDQHGKGDYDSLSRNSDKSLCPVILTEFYMQRLNYTNGIFYPL